VGEYFVGLVYQEIFFWKCAYKYRAADWREKSFSASSPQSILTLVDWDWTEDWPRSLILHTYVQIRIYVVRFVRLHAAYYVERHTGTVYCLLCCVLRDCDCGWRAGVADEGHRGRVVELELMISNIISKLLAIRWYDKAWWYVWGASEIY